MEYEIVEGPLESSVCVEEEGSVKYVQLAYKVQLKDALVQLRSEMHRGDIVLLKVCVEERREKGRRRRKRLREIYRMKRGREGFRERELGRPSNLSLNISRTIKRTTCTVALFW